MRHIDRTTWVVVVNSARAHIMRYEDLEDSLAGIALWHRRPGKQADDRPGRGRKIGSGAHYALGEDRSENEQESAELAQKCADFVNQAALNSKFDALVIAAPPATLGHYRGMLDAKASDRIIADFDKDLAHLTCDELLEYVRTNLPKKNVKICGQGNWGSWRLEASGFMISIGEGCKPCH